MSDADIKINGIEALNKALGASQALKFLAMLSREPTDYIQISNQLYEGQTIEEYLKEPGLTARNNSFRNRFTGIRGF
jgi:hypothetical protein